MEINFVLSLVDNSNPIFWVSFGENSQYWVLELASCDNFKIFAERCIYCIWTYGECLPLTISLSQLLTFLQVGIKASSQKILLYDGEGEGGEHPRRQWGFVIGLIHGTSSFRTYILYFRSYLSPFRQGEEWTSGWYEEVKIYDVSLLPCLEAIF